MTQTLALAGMAVVAAGGLAVAWRLRARQKRLLRQREAFIQRHEFPPHLHAALRETWPHLRDDELALVETAMRSHFLCWLQSGFRPVAMPSRLVDAFWHAFILDTRAYGAFCSIAFGRFFHHVPAALAGLASSQDEAMQRTWRLCCMQEGIRPDAPGGAPLLFRIDAQIGIPGAMRHDLEALRRGATSGSGCSGGACGGGRDADGGAGDGGGGCGGD
ncbi:MAG: hypothetical protein KF800_13140 [Lysobacter sp.]|nr:hypothetical protein [Lysobacter sp.]